jgi:beta-glucosidase
MGVSANVSQKALREIYLRAFRIAVTEGKPWTVMSSYNRVNGKYVCNSFDLLTGVLRQEWGFQGLVMSDWNAVDKCSYAQAINAGNDLIMPGTKAVTKKLYEDSTLNEKALDISAGRVLDLIFRSETCNDF